MCQSTLRNRKTNNNNTTLIAALVSGYLFLGFIVVVILYIHLPRQIAKEQTMPRELQTKDLYTVWSFDGRLVYEDNVEAIKEND